MKILTINLWNINAPFEVRMSALNNYISKEKPDCICFQEVSKHNGILQIDSILKEHGYNYSYRKSGLWKGREEGLAIATLGNHEIIESSALPYIENDMGRSLLGIKYNSRRYGKPVYIFNTHLAYHYDNSEGRIAQINYILERLQDFSKSKNLFLCGDFNEDPQQGNLYHYVLNNSKVLLRDCSSNIGLTFSSENQYVVPELWPNRKIDYIFSDTNEKFDAKIAMKKGVDGYDECSDHYGVLLCTNS